MLAINTIQASDNSKQLDFTNVIVYVIIVKLATVQAFGLLLANRRPLLRLTNRQRPQLLTMQISYFLWPFWG